MTTRTATEKEVIVGAVDQEGAAAYVGLGITKFTELEKAGEGPVYFREGRRKLYRIVRLEEWMTAREEKTARENAAAKERAEKAERAGWKLHEGRGV